MSEPHYIDPTVTVYSGDCLDVLAELPDASVDAVVTDPPYGLEFMGKEWDGFKPSSARIRRQSERDQEPGAAHNATTFLAARNMPDAFVAGHPFQAWCQLWAAECLRVLKPGGHLLAFGGTRTSHRLACAIEDAGFEIRDSIAWLYGSGFPKSLDVSKAIDKAAGAEREVVGVDSRYVGMSDRAKRALGGVVHEGTGGTGFSGDPSQITAPATPDAERWQGWGTSLKPAHEPVCVARKPLAGTVAANVLAHGTGALNVDGCRIDHDEPVKTTVRTAPRYNGDAYNNGAVGPVDTSTIRTAPAAGRWPANVVLDESQAAALDEQSGELTSGANPTRRGSDKFRDAYGDFAGQEECTPARGVDIGGASRFMYVAKAATDERPRVNGVAHPTVKPLSLMRWLVRLVTPPGGTVLEPFAGSGTTVEACILEGFRCIAIEREADYLPLILQRIHRRRDPVEAVRGSGEELGLFDLLDAGPIVPPDEGSRAGEASAERRYAEKGGTNFAAKPGRRRR